MLCVGDQGTVSSRGHKSNKRLGKAPYYTRWSTPRSPLAPFRFASGIRKKGFRLFVQTLQMLLPNLFSLVKVFYVVPLGISLGLPRPVTIASKICARLVKLWFSVESAGQPPELSEKKSFTLEAIAAIALQGVLE